MICLAIVGSRFYNDYIFVETYINNWSLKNGVPDEIISGGAKGVDKLAEIYANNHKIKFVLYEAEWKIYGLSAGPIRNKLIIDNSTHCIAFPGPVSTGTHVTIKYAKEKNVPCEIICVNS